jgi:hypothetical protein
MPKECAVCTEREKEIKRILGFYKKEKKYWRIYNISATSLLVIIALLGPDGLQFVLDTIKGIVE